LPQAIQAVPHLANTSWVIGGLDGVAARLSINGRHFSTKMRRLGISWPAEKSGYRVSHSAYRIA
jgi:hypothetical protein